MAPHKMLQLTLPTPLSSPIRNYFSCPIPLQNNIQGLGDLKRVGELGRGNEGIVYKVQHRKSCSYYALKVIRLDSEAHSTEKIMREVEILKKIHCPWIVQFEGAFEENGSVNFLLEYMDGGSLHGLLTPKKTMTESFLSKVAGQVLEGLKYLHNEKIVHGDIKPSNLLIKKNPLQIKIADFGVSRIVSEHAHASCNSYGGTYAYMSPERLDPNKVNYGDVVYEYGGDIWSLGVTLMECYVGHFPFLQPGEKQDFLTLLYAICFEDPPTLPPVASPEFRSFIQHCLEKDVTKRWTAPQLLNHPFVQSFIC